MATKKKTEVNENGVQFISAPGEERIYSREFQSMESVCASFETGQEGGLEDFTSIRSGSIRVPIPCGWAVAK